MSKIALITGITGQDGSYLAELLLEKNYKVHGLVRSDFQKEDSNKNWRLKNFINNLNLHNIEINNQKHLKDLISEINPDEVYHLAAQSYDGHSFDNEFYTFNVNLNFTHIILSLVQKTNEKSKFFFAGSSEMYSKELAEPINEKTNFSPSSAYGIAKLASHHLIKSYRETYKMYASTGILFNHESPKKDPRFVLRKISSSVAKIKMGLQKKIKLGDLKAKRDWGHAKDFAHAMWLMNQQKKADDYVIGTGKLHSVEDFAKKAFNYVGLNHNDYIEIDEKLKRNKDSKARLANISKIKKNLKWKPKFDFERLVIDMVENDLKLLKNK
tara:strand:+ start:3146 stop:4123 length:978 start_codon:yes stop_codon:yes gene_type:complete